jgi:hypothetical protein
MQAIPTRRRGVALLLLPALVAAPTDLPAQASLEPTAIAALAREATVQVRSVDEHGRRIGSGTGFLISPDGMIVTNFHVIAGAHSLQVDPADGAEHAQVLYVAGDPGHDIALIKLAAGGLPWLRIREEPEAEVGQRIYTMGHPLGQTATFSDGLVSALRTVEEVGLIQITAPISVGSSGSPVMNDAGEVIGIATMMLRGGQNLNFAVPVRYVASMLARADVPQPFSSTLLPRERRGIALLGAPMAPSRPPRPPRAPAPTPAPVDAWERQVLRQIATLEAALVAEGVARRSHPVEMGALRNGESATIEMPLRPSTPYAFVGVCDVDCTDVDLQLLAPDGTLLDQDLRVSDVPSVRYTPRTEGMYRLRVTMSGCEAAPCRFGVAAFVLQ